MARVRLSKHKNKAANDNKKKPKAKKAKLTKTQKAIKGSMKRVEELRKKPAKKPASKSPTGRATKSEPAIQNVPVRTKEGRAVRDALVKARKADIKGKKPADYSGAEKRIIANVTGRKMKDYKTVQAKLKNSAIKDTAWVNNKITPKQSTKIIDDAHKDAKKHGVSRKEVKASLERAGLTPEKVAKPKPTLEDTSALVPPDAVIRYKFDDGFNPSTQQMDLFDWVVLGQGNAFVEAVAGSGKTTSLLRALTFMHGSIAVLAFGTKIKDEFEHKVVKSKLRDRPGAKIDVKTVHAAGFSAIRRNPNYAGTKLAKNGEKDDLTLQHLIKLRRYPENRYPSHIFGAMFKLVSLAKQSAAIVSWDIEDHDKWMQLVEHYDVADSIPDDVDLDQALRQAIADAKEALQYARKLAPQWVDFNDMPWIPLVENMKFYQYDWVLIDEAQDLNEVRRLVAAKMMKPASRLIAVGDRHQAIFGFTGADSNSIELIIKAFDCTRLDLTVCYRCGHNIIKDAQKYVSHIQAFEKNPEGAVSNVGKEAFEKEHITGLNSNVAILCRNNKPVVSLAFRLIRMGIPAHVEGRSIGEGLVTLARKWKTAKTVEELDARLEHYLDHETKKLTEKKKESQLQTVTDKVETLRVIMEGVDTVDNLVAKIEGLFKDTNGDNKATVTLSTVHKAKGREWDTVYILGFAKYMPAFWARQPWQKEQENNLIYVAITRAINQLHYLEDLEEKKAA